MKKIFLTMCAALLCLGLLCSCDQNPVEEQSSETALPSETADTAAGTEEESKDTEYAETSAETSAADTSAYTSEEDKSSDELLYVYLGSYDLKEVFLIEKIGGYTGVKTQKNTFGSVVGYGLMVDGNTVVEPDYKSYELLTAKDAGNSVRTFIAFSRNEVAPGGIAITSVYSYDGKQVGEYTALQKLFSGQTGDYYTFTVDSESDPVNGCTGLLNANFEVVVPAEYQSILYGGYSTVERGKHALILDKLNESDKVETYTGYIDNNALVISEKAPYSGATRVDALKITDEDGNIKYMVGGNYIGQ